MVILLKVLVCIVFFRFNCFVIELGGNGVVWVKVRERGWKGERGKECMVGVEMSFNMKVKFGGGEGRWLGRFYSLA